MPSRGSALIAVLWSFVILSIVAVSTLRSTMREIRVAKNWSDIEEARWLAIAGIEKAKAAIHESRRTLREAGKTHDPALGNDAAAFRDVAMGNGVFRVIRSSRPAEGGGPDLFGVADEESRLDVNHASVAEIAKLPGMTPQLAAAIADARDDDDEVRAGGAEREEYASLVPPSEPRNAPFDSVRDLLLVMGVTQDLLFGEDANANGLLDPEENDGAATPPEDNADGILDAGWSAHISVSSSVENKDARGEARVNVASASEEDLAGVEGISTDIAKAIVAHRGNKQLETIADLLDVVAPPPTSGSSSSSSGSASSSGSRSQGSGSQGSGEKLISTTLLKEIADKITTTDETELHGVVNLNTADTTVLACLPGVEPDLAQAIAARRTEVGFFSSIADLLDVPGLSRQTFAGLARRVSVRAGTFRILSEGRIPSTGAVRRVFAVVRPSSFEMRTIDWREEP